MKIQLIQSIACFCLLEQHLFLGKGHLQPKGESPISRGQGCISKQLHKCIQNNARQKQALSAQWQDSRLGEISLVEALKAIESQIPHTRSRFKLPNLCQGVSVSLSVVEKTSATVQLSSSRSLKEKNPLPF